MDKDKLKAIYKQILSDEYGIDLDSYTKQEIKAIALLLYDMSGIKNK